MKGQDTPAERLSTHKAAWTPGRKQGDLCTHWMDGWMVAPSYGEKLGTSGGFVLWSTGFDPHHGPGSPPPPPLKALQHPTREGLFSHTVLSVFNATLPTSLCPPLLLFLIPIPPNPWKQSPPLPASDSLPWAHHPSRWVLKENFSWKIGYSFPNP